MRFSMTHHFKCAPDDLWDVFAEPEFDRRLREETGVERELLEAKYEDGVQFERIRSVSNRELPAVMKTALGIERFEFEQQNRLDRSENILNWTVSTPFLSDRVDAGGTTRVEATDTGCTRIIDGQVDIRLPLVGRKMERKLLGNIRESYEKAARIAADLLQKR